MPNTRRSITKSENFSMCRWVARQLALVVSASNYLAVAHDDGADRDIVVGECSTRFDERELHELVVSH
jgi:hypothetical protein